MPIGPRASLFGTQNERSDRSDRAGWGSGQGGDEVGGEGRAAAAANERWTRAAPSASAGKVMSRRYSAVVKPWAKSPSATSPATLVISGPTPANITWGGPCGDAGGVKKGVMIVCV